MTRPDPRPTGASRPLPHRSPMNVRHYVYLQHSLARVIHAEKAARYSAEARADRLLDRPPRRPLRQAIGHSMVRIGARLAAEPTLGPARSR
jgi:hypothetical protein